MIESATPITDRPVRFTPEQYVFLSENNMVGSGRTELIHGEIRKMCSQFDSHTFGVTETFDQLRRLFPKSKFWIRPQSSLACGESIPEPDIAVIDGPARSERAVMRGERAVLVVEIADTTLDTDLNIKPAIYAGAGIPEYWVLDLNSRKLIVHRDPVTGGRLGPRYKSVTTLDRSGKIAPLALPKRSIRVASIVG